MGQAISLISPLHQNLKVPAHLHLFSYLTWNASIWLAFRANYTFECELCQDRRQSKPKYWNSHSSGRCYQAPLQNADDRFLHRKHLHQLSFTFHMFHYFEEPMHAMRNGGYVSGVRGTHLGGTCWCKKSTVLFYLPSLRTFFLQAIQFLSTFCVEGAIAAPSFKQ